MRTWCHDFPDLARHIQQGSGIVHALRPGLVDQRLPHQPPAEAERPEYVVQRHALLGSATSGFAGRVEVVIGCGLVRTGDHFHDPGNVVVT